MKWYERIIWRIFSWMIKKRGYTYFDGIAMEDGKGIKALVISTVPIEREY